MNMTTKPTIGHLVRVANEVSLYHNRFGIITDTEGIYCTVVWCNPAPAENDRWLAISPESEVRRDILEVLS